MSPVANRFLRRGYGEIGRHARFRFWCRKAWEFKSLYPHQSHQARKWRFPRLWVIVERHFACQKATEFSKATAGKWTGGVLAIAPPTK